MSEEDYSDTDDDEPDKVYLLNRLKDVEMTIKLEQLIRVHDDHAAADAATVPKLAIYSLLSIIEDDANPKESQQVIFDTCQYLIEKLQFMYVQEAAGAKFDTLAKRALCEALSSRIPGMPADRIAKVDGCETILSDSDAKVQILPATMKKQIAKFLRCQKDITGSIWMREFTNAPTSLEDFYEHERSNDLKFAMNVMFEFSTDDCLEVFLPEGRDVDDLIEEFAQKEANETADMLVSIYAGILKALSDYKMFHESKAAGTELTDGVERADDGHVVYEEDEPEMYHGWTGSWQENDNSPEKNSFWYGVKLETLLTHAEEYYSANIVNETASSRFSCSYAKFHGDAAPSRSSAKPANEPINESDIAICRARHREIDGEVFYSDGTAYSNTWSAQDGSIGFSHVGSGWKNREFKGYLYSFDVSSNEARGFGAAEISHEFWSTPSDMLCDDSSGIAWIHGDQRIKGFCLSQAGSLSFAETKYIFKIEKNPQASTSDSSRDLKRRREMLCDSNSGHGDRSLLALGGRLCFINQGYVQEWKLDEGSMHSGASRMVNMDSVDEDIAHGGWRPEDIIDLSKNTWMDDTGAAEVTRGLKPYSIRPIDFVNPSSVGYLSNDRLAFANAKVDGFHCSNGQIPILDYDLREVSRLAGFGSSGVVVVQRPTFEKAGDESTLVASDYSTVKILDLRTGKAEMTILQQGVEDSTPVYAGTGKFICNRLTRGKGSMMWDLRNKKPLYTLPTDSDVAWIPGGSDDTKPPALMSGNEIFMFCRRRDSMSDRELEWEKKHAAYKWANLEKNGGGNCSIM